ncbi:MAG: hypothetical protein ACUVTZ_00305 [Armatimonadota bacterium]
MARACLAVWLLLWAALRACALQNVLSLDGPAVLRHGSDAVFVLRAPEGLRGAAQLELAPRIPLLRDRESMPGTDEPVCATAIEPSPFARQLLSGAKPRQGITTSRSVALAFCAVHVSADAFPGTWASIGLDYRLLDPEGHAVGAGTAVREVQIWADLPRRTDLADAESVVVGDYEVGPAQEFDVRIIAGEGLARAGFAYVRLACEVPDPPEPPLSLVAAWGPDPARDWGRPPVDFTLVQRVFWGPRDPFEGSESVRTTLSASAPFGIAAPGAVLNVRFHTPLVADIALYRLRLDAALFDMDGNPIPVRVVNGTVRVDPQLPQGSATRFVYGDLDGNGRVTVADAVKALRGLSGVARLSADQFRAADIYPFPGIGGRTAGDGMLTLSDVLAVLHRALGIESRSILKSSKPR